MELIIVRNVLREYVKDGIHEENVVFMSGKGWRMFQLFVYRANCNHVQSRKGACWGHVRSMLVES